MLDLYLKVQYFGIMMWKNDFTERLLLNTSILGGHINETDI